MKLLTKADTRICITASIISYGISYSIYTTLVLLNTFIFLILFRFEQADPNLFFNTTLLIYQLIFSLLLFRIKRIRKGLPFLYSDNTPFLDILLSLLVIFSFTLLGGTLLPTPIAIITTIMIPILFIVTFFLWKRNIARLYLERQKEKELEILYATIEENTTLIDKLQNDNQELAKIIHKDNKRIPSIENAVLSLLHNQQPLLQEEKETILEQLNTLKQERTQTIQHYGATPQKLPRTGHFLIDSMNDYMQQKALADQATFEVSITADMNFNPGVTLSERDFCTLFSDLIENALIAVRHSEQKNIAVSFETRNGYPAVVIRDSGIPFEPKVLLNMGRKRITTHAREGGSGIGLMSLFELLHKSKASLVIHEYPPQSGIFTKFVMVVFDHRHEYRIESPRAGALRNFCNRDEIIYTELVEESSEQLETMHQKSPSR